VRIPKKYKSLYREELIKIRISIILMVLFSIATIALPILAFLSVIPNYNILLSPVFVFICKKEIDHLIIQRSLLFFKRYLLEPEFANELYAKNNSNQDV